VLAVLESTGFRPNAAARTLALGRSGVVGVVLHVDPHQLFQDRYFSLLLQGMTDGIAEQATGMMLWLANRSKEETRDRILHMNLLDGVIVSASQLDDPLVDGLLAALPTVLLGHRRPTGARATWTSTTSTPPTR
jgi:LacI family transcriptional regulator